MRDPDSRSSDSADRTVKAKPAKAEPSAHVGYRLVTVDGAHGAVCRCGEQSPSLPSVVAADEWWAAHTGADDETDEE